MSNLFFDPPIVVNGNEDVVVDAVNMTYAHVREDGTVISTGKVHNMKFREGPQAKVPDPNLGPVALAHALAQAVGIQLRPLNKWHKISFYVANCGGTLVTSGITFVPVDEKGETAGHIKAVLGKQEFPV